MMDKGDFRAMTDPIKKKMTSHIMISSTMIKSPASYIASQLPDAVLTSYIRS